ncbi:MAG: hypothetical protein KQ78_01738 [Candidatus Izimaplasma bacterium HR2]|nr:MAG: hypothetical protein KQ78_01738 [Candidatus Izimaplasma bacterium HR2]
MNNYTMMMITSVLGSLLGLILLIASYFLGSMFFFFMGILFVILGILSLILVNSLKIFMMDKELNIEALKKAGLTIIKCSNCLKDNVLED